MIYKYGWIKLNNIRVLCIFNLENHTSFWCWELLQNNSQIYSMVRFNTPIRKIDFISDTNLL